MTETEVERRAQKSATLQFWDDFYDCDCVHEETNKEWVAQPNEILFEKLLQATNTSKDNDNNDASNLPPPRRILEVGCGNSTLSRDLYLYLRQKYSKHQFHVVATDVSDVCIQQMRHRDAACLRLQTTQSDTSDKEGLEYCVWNITSPPPPRFMDYFDVVLDKGCLDTFLFRSRHRGPGRFELMETFLEQITACLKMQENLTSRYLCISPRRKIKPLRDGIFLQYIMPPQALPRDDGELVGDRERNTYYLHACRRRRQRKNSASIISKEEKRPCDQDICHACRMTFWDFRKGEALEGRGSDFWYRRWKGHCQHCFQSSQA